MASSSPIPELGMEGPPPPWLDLPNHVTEKILERLPLSDYVRFAAVCRHWRSVQLDHRRRYAPSAPPMLSLPWFIPAKPKQDIVSCYSPFQDRSYRLRLPSNQTSEPYCHSFPHGWLLAVDLPASYNSDSCCFSLLNPVSEVKISLPQGKGMRFEMLDIGYVTAISPPPNYVVSIIYNRALFLLRWCDPCWTRLELPRAPTKPISCGGKHYCISSEGNGSQTFHTYTPDGGWVKNSYGDHFLVIDPLPTTPTVQYFQMMDWGKQSEGSGLRHGVTRLVECNGEPLLVKEIRKDERICMSTVGFHVFKADLSKKMWVRVESLGDRLLILQSIYSVSFLAMDIGIKGNCIYFSKDLTFRHWSNESEPAAWMVFDLSTGRVTVVPLPNASQIDKYAQRIFIPSLC